MLKLMQTCAGFGGIIILIIGLMMLGVTIWAFTQSALFFKNYTFLGILLAADLLIIFGAVIGILGIKRRNGIMIFIFQIYAMVFFVVFLGLGITAFILPKDVFNGSCTDSSNQYLRIANTAYAASNILCLPEAQALSCACALSDYAIDNGGYNFAQKAILKAMNRSGNAYKFQDCAQAKVFPFNQDNYTFTYGILEAVEQSLDCSGWCAGGSLFYKFSDINRGLPSQDQGCYDTMKDAVHKYGGTVGIFSMIAALFMLLVTICGLCVCCSKKHEPFASRFVYRQNGYYRVA